MKALKYIVQILTSIVYSSVLAWFLGWLLYLLFNWVISLSARWIVFLFLFGGSSFIAYIFILVLGGVGSLPFLWTNKENIVATILSILVMVVLFVYWVISLFKIPHGGGFVPVFSLIYFVSIFLGIAASITIGSIRGYLEQGL